MADETMFAASYVLKAPGAMKHPKDRYFKPGDQVKKTEVLASKSWDRHIAEGHIQSKALGNQPPKPVRQTPKTTSEKEMPAKKRA